MDQETLKALEICLKTAHDAGVPEDQAGRFINLKYIPLPWQWEFHAIARQADLDDGPVDVGAGGARGPGKALSLDTLIPTPMGFITMGDVKVGDSVYAPDGSITKVTAISGIQDNRICYDVIFSDGSVITADADHLWLTLTKSERVASVKRTDEYRKNRRLKRDKEHRQVLVGLNTKAKPTPQQRTTQQIKETLYYNEKEINHSIDVTEPIQSADAILPIHPYLLGVWLGDGHSDAGKITCFDEQIIDEIRDLGYNVYRLKAEGSWRVEGLTALLRQHNLFKNKHIPTIYLRSSIRQRLAVLQGLNDTDGCVDKDGSIEFTIIKENLANEYYELACSLGVKATIKKGTATLNGRRISDKWRIRYTAPFDAFLLFRKRRKQNITPTQIIKRRFIVEVRERESVPVRCIQVNRPDGMYLVGRSFIPTHNSHMILSQVALDDCQRVDNLKCLFLRQTGVAAKESFDDLIDKAVVGHCPYERVGSMLKVGNGSRIVLGGFKDANDIDKYIGIEYDIIIVEELNQLTEEKYTKLRGSLRTSKPNWRPRMYTSFNPGGLGHEFVKQRYIIPHRNNTEKDTRFIGSTYKSNPYLNKEYIEYLESLTGDLGRAWREGEWDLFSGQVFGEFSRAKHVMRPIVPNASFDHYLAFDWGYSEKSMFAAYLSAVIKMKTEDGQNFQRVITYREWAGNQKSPQEWASIIYADCKAIGIKPYKGICDPAMLNTQTDGSKAIADLMKSKWRELHGDEWVTMVRGSRNRIGRWATYHNWLSMGPDDLPYWMIGENCTYLIETIPQMQYDEIKIDDINCFIAGTKIKTLKGQKNVEDIVKGDLIWTPVGYREAYVVGEPVKTKVVKVFFNDGRVLEGTAYHKVMVLGKGLVELQHLNCHDILMQWNTKEVRNISPLFIRALSIENTTTDAIMNRMAHLLPKAIPTFIVKYGLMLMAPFLKVCMFIIKIMIRTIMIFQIFNLWRRENMRFYTTERELNRENSQIILKNGGTQKREKKRSVRMLIRCMREVLLGNYRALIVKELLRHDPKYKNTVKSTIIMQGLKKLYAKYVKRYSIRSMGRDKAKHALISAVGYSGEKEVYRLNVKQAHLYSANGFVVTNTKLNDHGVDSTSYFLSRIPFISVKKGALPYKSGVELKRVEWTKDGTQQIGLDPKAFQDMYR